MENYPTWYDYCKDFLVKVWGTLFKNFKEIGRLNKKEFEPKIDTFCNEVQTNPEYFKNLSQVIALNSETLELIIRICKIVSFKKYSENVWHLGNDNTKLRNWLQEAQSKNKTWDNWTKEASGTQKDEPIKKGDQKDSASKK